MKTYKDTAWAFASIMAVSSTMVVGCNKAPEAMDATPPSITIGTQIDDSVLTTAVKAALLADPIVKSYDLQVETRKGEVQLSGYVDDLAQVDKALEVTRGVAGVKSVLNKLNLKGSSATVGENVDDVVVTTRVKTALLADASIKSLDITVVTLKGDVQLSGFVNDQNQIVQAVRLARGVEGVHSIHNELMVKK